MLRRAALGVGFLCLHCALAFAADGQAAASQSPAAFLDMLRQIASCDLREIDHVARIIGAKASIAPHMIEWNGRKILGGIGVNLDPAPEAFREPLFGYVIAIPHGSQNHGQIIASINMSWMPGVGCIRASTLASYFGVPVKTIAATDGGGRAITYQTSKTFEYQTSLQAGFAATSPCSTNIALVQERTEN